MRPANQGIPDSKERELTWVDTILTAIFISLGVAGVVLLASPCSSPTYNIRIFFVLHDMGSDDSTDYLVWNSRRLAAGRPLKAAAGYPA